jgi:uncharacterized NAD(P)/FAD-binding protein YdhS
VATNVLIVGGGASGVLLAIHLLRDGADAFHVTILERRPSLGAGVAYATNQPDHLLNVRASNMSAFPDDPGHFAHWLQGQDAAGQAGSYGPDSFAPRNRYRDYLGSLLEPLIADGRLLHIQAEAIAVLDTKAGVEIASSDGARHFGGIAVIATGNEGPGLTVEPWRFEGWTDGGHPDLAPDAPVVVVGTGLTMVDRVLSLLQNGHVGNITAVSRRGLPPQVHRPGTAQAIDAEAIPFGQSASHLTAWMRQRTRAAERMGLDWRSVVDAMRPHTQTLWHQLPLAERRRFLRHARPYWDVHRHRIAPDAARQLEMAKQRGQLQIIAAHVAEFVPQDTGVEVRIARRGAGTERDHPCGSRVRVSRARSEYRTIGEPGAARHAARWSCAAGRTGPRPRGHHRLRGHRRDGKRIRTVLCRGAGHLWHILGDRCYPRHKTTGAASCATSIHANAGSWLDGQAACIVVVIARRRRATFSAERRKN